jgi:hypothetical protein
MDKRSSLLCVLVSEDETSLKTLILSLVVAFNFELCFVVVEVSNRPAVLDWWLKLTLMVPVEISRHFGLFLFLFLEIGGNTEVGYSSQHPRVEGSSPPTTSGPEWGLNCCNSNSGRGALEPFWS